MKLHWSPRSPFVRKILIGAHEIGIAGRIECVRSVAVMERPNPVLMRDNPLSKIPTLVLDDGTVIYDSPVILEYFDTLHDGPRLIPAEWPARLTALRRQALGDGALDILLLWRHELNRSGDDHSELYKASFATKIGAALDALETEADDLGAAPFGVGHIAIGAMLAYADFRLPEIGWRAGRPRLSAWHEGFAARPSVQAAPIVDGP